MDKKDEKLNKTHYELLREIHNVLITTPLHGEGLVDQGKRHETMLQEQCSTVNNHKKYWKAVFYIAGTIIATLIGVFIKSNV